MSEIKPDETLKSIMSDFPRNRRNETWYDKLDEVDQKRIDAIVVEIDEKDRKVLPIADNIVKHLKPPAKRLAVARYLRRRVNERRNSRRNS